MKKLRVNLMTKDVNATVDYYKDVFRANLITSVPESGTFDFALMSLGDIELMFESVKSLGGSIPELNDFPKLGGTFTLFIDVDDVDGLYSQVKDKVRMLVDMHETFYGTKEFYIADLNGYILAFAEKLNK